MNSAHSASLDSPASPGAPFAGLTPERVLEGATLHEFDGFRFSVFDRRGGRVPDLDNTDTLEWLGRFIGRIHAVGTIEPYRERPTLDIHTSAKNRARFCSITVSCPPMFAKPTNARSQWRSTASRSVSSARAT